ncbi:MAG TPA: V4R domain-containing protein [Gemmatimonadaceae bacterium]|nr:V4R domain-containing protein [Gemmatimonadaceae bacterium]
MSTTIELLPQQLVTLPRASISALRTALLRDAGPGFSSYLQEAGYAGGEAIYAAFREWLTARGADLPEDLPIGAFATQSAAFFTDTGWGHFDVTPIRDLAAIIESSDWAESDPDARFDHPSCHFTTGLLADFFGRVASTPLAVLEVECRSSGGECCRFIAGSAEVMQHVYDRMADGADHMAALDELE